MDFLPIVGMGLAGDEEDALKTFFTHLPKQTGMSFVLVHDLPRKKAKPLAKKLKQWTGMKICEVTDNLPVAPDCIYVSPPKQYLGILNGTLYFIAPVPGESAATRIDYFFKSLARDQRENAIGILFTGLASVGAAGLQAIKTEGGMGITHASAAQAKDLPQPYSISHRLADFVLPAEKIAEALIQFTDRSLAMGLIKKEPLLQEIQNYLNKIILVLRSTVGHDFSSYKPYTILRRVERRMAAHQIEKIEEYIDFLQQNYNEVRLLHKDLLISVTSFFRDPEAYVVLENLVFPQMFANKSDGKPIRIWVPGCATGEEAYSIAIALNEFKIKQKLTNTRVQIFATDVDRDSIDFARVGIYPESIAADLPAELLQKYFVNKVNTYQITKEIRKVLIFATQDLIKDPPFSKLDLISCRNLLIYFKSALQKKIMPIFHYALNPGGYLLLGASETVGEFTDLFSLVDKKWKVYQKKYLSRPAPIEMPVFSKFELIESKKLAGEMVMDEEVSVRALAEKYLLKNFSPACVVINDKKHILYFHGRTSKYLELPVGEPTLNILNMARQELKIKLRTAIHKAIKNPNNIVTEQADLKIQEEVHPVRLTVKPILEPDSMKGLFMVIFEDLPQSEAPEPESTVERDEDDSVSRYRELEQELNSTREYLQATIEELEDSNKKLMAANEQLQSTNEELQSTNEEQETSREELQSINEELVTVNAELQKKIDELSHVNNDMNNLLASTEIGVIFLDSEFRLKRFTPPATKVFRLINKDIGESIEHIASSILYSDLIADIQDVFKSQNSRAVEVQTRQGEWYKVHVLPYRTEENIVDGVVITLMNITDIKLAEAQIKKSEQLWSDTFNALDDIVVILDNEYNILKVNEAGIKIFGSEMAKAEGKKCYHLFEQTHEPIEACPVRKFLSSGRTESSEYYDARLKRHFLLKCSPIMEPQGSVTGFVHLIRDISETKGPSVPARGK